MELRLRNRSFACGDAGRETFPSVCRWKLKRQCENHYCHSHFPDTPELEAMRSGTRTGRLRQGAAESDEPVTENRLSSAPSIIPKLLILAESRGSWRLAKPTVARAFCQPPSVTLMLDFITKTSKYLTKFVTTLLVSVSCKCDCETLPILPSSVAIKGAGRFVSHLCADRSLWRSPSTGSSLAGGNPSRVPAIRNPRMHRPWRNGRRLQGPPTAARPVVST